MDNQCICAIRNIYKSISAFETSLEKKFGLNINEIMLLCTLSETEMLSSGEIAEHMALSRSNTSKVISSLEKKQHIRRESCSEDARCMRFHLTRKGAALLKQVNCQQIQLPTNLQQLIGIKSN